MSYIMRFKVGIIGATGFIGSPYRKEIRDASNHSEIVALCSRRKDRLKAAALEDNCEFYTDDYKKVVDHPDVNLVVVLTPDALHKEAVLRAIESGKHVFCDKPIGASVKEAYEMWCAIRDTQLAHYVPYWTRYEPKFQYVKQLVANGTLGDIRAVIYRWQNNRPLSIPFTWRDDVNLSAAGSIADVGSHAYDVVRWILGEEAVKLVSQAGAISPPKPYIGEIDLAEAIEWGSSHSITDSQQTKQGTAYDYATITWQFSNNAVGAIILSHAPVIRKGLAPELELHGTKSSVSIDRVQHKVTLLSNDEEPKIKFIPENPVNRWNQFVFPALKQQIANENCAHPGFKDGWRTQIFTQAAVESAKRKQWVDVSEFDEEA